MKITKEIAIIFALIAFTYGAIGAQKSKKIVKIDVPETPLNDEDIEETHMFIRNDLNEEGALIDQKVLKDKKNGLLIIHMPAHYDKVESTTVFDLDSEWMMTVLPEIEDCQMMKKPVIETNNIEKEAFDLAKADKSTSSDPIVVSSENSRMTSFDTIIGYEIQHDDIPKKFQPHCPTHYTIHTTQVVLEGNSPTFTGNEEYDYDNPKNDQAHPRFRRYTSNWSWNDPLVCKDFNGNKISGCKRVYGVQCPGGTCSAKDAIWRCHQLTREQQLAGRKSCYYHLVPCEQVTNRNGRKLSDDGMNTCTIHFANNVEKCTKCCRNQNCGVEMPKCGPSLEGSSHCMWGPWSAWGECSTKCRPGKKERKREVRHKPGVDHSIVSCEGSETNTLDCDGTIPQEKRDQLRTLSPELYAMMCT